MDITHIDLLGCLLYCEHDKVIELLKKYNHNKINYNYNITKMWIIIELFYNIDCQYALASNMQFIENTFNGCMELFRDCLL